MRGWTSWLPRWSLLRSEQASRAFGSFLRWHGLLLSGTRVYHSDSCQLRAMEYGSPAEAAEAATERVAQARVALAAKQGLLVPVPVEVSNRDVPEQCHGLEGVSGVDKEDVVELWLDTMYFRLQFMAARCKRQRLRWRIVTICMMPLSGIRCWWMGRGFTQARRRQSILLALRLR